MWLQYLLGVHNNLLGWQSSSYLWGQKLLAAEPRDLHIFSYLLNKQALNAYGKEFKGHVRIIFQPLGA